MDIYATLWATLISSTTSIIQLLYNHCEWKIQCLAQLAESFVIVDSGVGEGWLLHCLISLWHWPHSLSSDTSRDLGWGRGWTDIIKNQNSWSNIFFLSEEGLLDSGEMDKWNPETSTSQTMTFSGLTVAKHPRTDSTTLTQAVWDHLTRMSNLGVCCFCYFLFPHQDFPCSHLLPVIFVAKTNIAGLLVLLFWGTFLVQSTLPKETQSMISLCSFFP